jgi:hypothetical protein
MLRSTAISCARSQTRGRKFVWGAPGKPLIRLAKPDKAPWGAQSHMNIVLTAEHHRSKATRFYAYLGKHVPRPQKALWSPDTPVPQDQYSYKLTTLDVDTFKYWFGLKEARVDRGTAKLLQKAGLLPPALHQFNPLMPRPNFRKEELYRHWLKNRPPLDAKRRDDYYHYTSSTDKFRPDSKADVPQAPWL